MPRKPQGLRRNPEGPVLYRLSFKDNDYWCVGSTIRPLSVRKWEYFQQARDGVIKHKLYELIAAVGMKGFELKTVMQCGPCDKKTLRQAEEEYWETHKDAMCLNKYAPRMSEDRNRGMQRLRERKFKDNKKIRGLLTDACAIVIEEMKEGKLPHLELVD